MEFAQVEGVAVIPAAVAVVVGHAGRGGRVIVAIDALDDTFRVGQVHDFAGQGEEFLQLWPGQVAVRFARGVGVGLVEVADHDIARVGAHQAFHLLGLFDGLEHLVAPQTAEEG